MSPLPKPCSTFEESQRLVRSLGVPFGSDNWELFMLSSSSSYRLKRFANSRDPDFAAALLIYVRYTPPSIRSDSREITYWIDNDKLNDTFYVFGFYRNRQLVGYAQSAYFPSEYLYFIEYLTIDENQRRNNVFFEMVEQIKDFLENAHPDYRYGVTEVMNEPGQDQPSDAKKLLTRLLKFIGFRVIHAPYFQPRLMMNDSESELSGALLIYCPTPLESIRSETYLSILRTVYYENYLRWKGENSSVKAIYKKHLDTLYLKVESEVRKTPTLIVNGYREILSASERPPIITMHRIVSFSAQGLFIVLLLTATMLSLKWVFGLSNASFAAIYCLAISSFLALAGIVSKEARAMFQEVASLAKYFFGRRRNNSVPTELDPVKSLPSNPNDE
jgi:hypothetical protein